MLRILNLGAGVQSTTVLLMSNHGEIPKLDHIVFADTGWEPKAVYNHLEWLKSVASDASIPLHIVQQGNIRNDALVSQVRGKVIDGVRWASMPLFTLSADGERGMIRRQCTSALKVRPIEQFIRRQLLNLAKRQRAPANSVTQVFGISIDEFQRMRSSAEKWKSYSYPLVEKRISRMGCLAWLERHGYPEPPRSACIGCPYHSDTEWRDLKRNRTDEWMDAVDFDDAIRNCEGMRGQMFLHRSCRPLSEVDLRTDFDKGQLPLWQGECDGVCAT